MTLAAVAGFIIGGDGFTASSGLPSHVLYGFLHANLFHLLCNLFVLWSIRGRIEAPMAFVVSVAASFLPQFVIAPTVGMSGFLFAVFGIMWGKTGRFVGMMKAGLPFIAITMLLPGVNGTLHFYCYLIGFMVGYFESFIFIDKV